ncbi:MAG: HD-GYP domain-containing protein [Gammaproteobacteria bacterium]|nr:HD-GYP domain-containing protein [Gammaproteobacteria bacterium]
MKVKVDVSRLRKGMYVCELDRPWTETTFLLQGILIENADDIQQVSQFCEYVYVDSEKSYGDIQPHLRTLKQVDESHDSEGHAIANASKAADLEQSNFQKELKIGRKIHARARSFIDRALEDIRLGQSVNTAAAREVVSEIADSITRSPHAMVWLANIKDRDEYTSIHCMNVCIMAVSFGRSLGMEKAELEILGLGGLLHDLGKICVPLEILNKPGKLTFDEFEIMKTHPMEGFRILEQQGDVPLDVLDIVKHHHERRNGKGYPSQLTGEEINHLTRIVAIVDVYDAITSDRCYHDAITPYDALKNMYDWINEDFDKEIIEKFIKCLGIYPIGCVVELNMGHVGIIVSASEKSKLRPIVLLILNSKKEVFPHPKLINLAHPKWRTGAQKLEIKRILSKNEYDFNIKDIIESENII